MVAAAVGHAEVRCPWCDGVNVGEGEAPAASGEPEATSPTGWTGKRIYVCLDCSHGFRD